MSMVIVVPARGGSKRVPRKNIAPLGGRPLLAWTLELARTAAPTLPLLVSTEDEEISRVAIDAGARVVRRPQALAGDSASTESVLLDALDQAEGQFDWIMCLPPTSPFRSAATLRRFVEMAVEADPDVDCLLSVTETRGDFWRSSPGGGWRRLFPDAPRRQQDREPLFEENSAVYLTRVDALRRTGFILGNKAVGVPIDPVEAMDINNPHDLKLAEAMLAAGLARLESP